MHCIPWGEAASTEVQLVPDESGVRFTSSLGQQPVSTIYTKRVLTCPLHVRSKEPVEVRCVRAMQLQNLTPFTSVSAEDGIDSCNPVSADLSGQYVLLIGKDDQHPTPNISCLVLVLR